MIPPHPLSSLPHTHTSADVAAESSWSARGPPASKKECWHRNVHYYPNVCIITLMRVRFLLICDVLGIGGVCVELCCVVLCGVVLCYVVLCYFMFCCVVLCCVVWYGVMCCVVL